jgi:hypothetical protein
MKWKVVSTHFGKLERALNRLGEEGFDVWKLLILTPESARTKRFVVIVIARSTQTTQLAEPICADAPLNEALFVTTGDDQKNAVNLQADEIPFLDNQLASKPWHGKLVDPDFLPDRKTGRFHVHEPRTSQTD